MTDGLTIFSATTEPDMEDIRTLFREYQQWLGVDLCFQGFEDELDTLPGRYAPPLGRLYLVRDDTSARIAGCVAIRPLGDGRCEMKRLYVRDAWKGRGLGRELAQLVLNEAREAGHAIMCLDTLERLKAAIALYKSLGFRNVDAYYDNPLDGICYMEIALA